MCQGGDRPHVGSLTQPHVPSLCLALRQANVCKRCLLRDHNTEPILCRSPSDYSVVSRELNQSQKYLFQILTVGFIVKFR